MKLVFTNRDQLPHRSGVANADVQPGGTKSTVGRTNREAAFEMELSTAKFSTTVMLDPSDQGYTQVTYWEALMNGPVTAVSPAPGVGFTIKDVTGTTTQSVVEPVGLALYDDAACTIPSAKAHFTTVQTGTLSSSFPSGNPNAIEATTNGGVLSATVARNPGIAPGVTVFARAFSLGSGSTAGASTHIMDSHLTQQITIN